MRGRLSRSVVVFGRIALIPVERGKHFCRATRICRRGSLLATKPSDQRTVNPRPAQSQTMLRSAGSENLCLTMSQTAQCYQSTMFSAVPKAILNCAEVAFGRRCRSQVGDHRSHDVRCRGLGSRVTIRLHGDRDQAEDGN